jgi:hypothetical protein
MQEPCHSRFFTAAVLDRMQFATFRCMQNYRNHRKVYPTHHLVFYPVVIAGICFSLYYMRQYPEQQFAFALLAIVFFIIAWLSFMLRQHYALGLQNRLVRLEMRLRYFQLTGKPFEPLEDKLTFGQIAALRFAADTELPDLLQRTLQEGLSANQIKKAVQHWQADHIRV